MVSIEDGLANRYQGTAPEVGSSLGSAITAKLRIDCGTTSVLVAGTRVFLGVHWFTDVIAGLLLGWGWFALCSIAFGGRLLTFGVPVAAAEHIADDALVTP